MSFINSHSLIELKSILLTMVEQDRITGQEALDILEKAGLTKLSEGSTDFVDEEGGVYSAV